MKRSRRSPPSIDAKPQSWKCAISGESAARRPHTFSVFRTPQSRARCVWPRHGCDGICWVTAKRRNVDPERWARVEELFVKAADLAEDDRAEFLSQACAGNESLRQ